MGFSFGERNYLGGGGGGLEFLDVNFCKCLTRNSVNFFWNSWVHFVNFLAENNHNKRSACDFSTRLWSRP